MKLTSVQNRRLSFFFATILSLCLLASCFCATVGELKAAELPKHLIGNKWKLSIDYKLPFGMLGIATFEITNDSYQLNLAGSSYECYEGTITGSGTIYGENISGSWTWFQKEYDVKSDFSWAKIETTINYTYTHAGMLHTRIYQEERAYNPPLEGNKGFPLSAGKSWSAASVETVVSTVTLDGKTTHDTDDNSVVMDFFVVRTEMTTVSAGEFETFVVRRTNRDGTYRETYYSPKANFDVKHVEYDNAGKVTATLELLEYTLISEGFPILYIIAGAIVTAIIIVGSIAYILFRRRKKHELIPPPPTERDVQVTTLTQKRQSGSQPFLEESIGQSLLKFT